MTNTFRQTVTALLLGLCLAPAAGLDPRKDLQAYSVDEYTTADGLPQSSILFVVQSGDGYLWLGTYEGLARFDGIRFEVFDKGNLAGMKSNSIKALFHDSRGRLWIGTPNGLLRYQNGSCRVYTTEDNLTSNFILSVYEDRARTIWVGTTRGLNRLERERFVPYTATEGLSHEYILALAEDAAGRLWIGTGGGGVNVLENGRFIPYTTANGLPNNDIRTLYRDREGRLWIGTSGSGLVEWQEGRFKTYSRAEGLTNDDIRAIYQDREGTLWVGTNGGGLNCLRKGAATFANARQGMTNSFIRSILEDHEGSLWVGTRQGLFRLKDDKFVIYNTRNGLPINEIRAVFEDSGGRFWAGTMGSGLVQVRPEGPAIYDHRSGLQSDQVWSIAEGRDGALWFGTYGGGLNCLRDGRMTTYTRRDGLTNDIIRAIHVDRANRVWVGTNGGGINILEKGRISRFTSQNGLSNDFIYAVNEDRDGAIWIGTYSGGINRYQDGRFTVFGPKEGVTSNAVWAIYPDRDGVIWFGTDNAGLLRYKEGRFTTFTIQDGLFSDLVFQILEDDSGNLWMNCNKGIFKIAKRSFDDYLAGRIGRLQYVSFGQPEGIRTIECAGPAQPAGWRSRDGKLWFPTIEGIVMFDPRNFFVNKVPPPVVIERVSINGSTFAPGDTPSVPPGDGSLQIDYTGLSYFLPNKVMFQYTLAPFDRKWISAGNRRSAFYTNLPPGTYTFRVVACNNDAVWNERGATFRFTLQSHFYQTAWFWVLVVLAIMLCAFALHRYRVQRLHRRQQELELLVSERTDQLSAANAELKRYATTDDITGIANHRMFYDFFDREWRRAIRSTKPIAVMMVDVDYFKQYNDFFGHQQGDECLRRIAHALAGVVHRGGDLVARYGGDEFVVVLAETGQEVVMVAEKMREAVHNLAIRHGDPAIDGNVTISLGCAQIVPTEVDEAMDLVRAADRALYQSKQNGRDRCTCT